MKNNCENCARALRRLFKLKELQPGRPEGETQHCPDCGDRRFVVSITVSDWLAGEDSDGRKKNSSVNPRFQQVTSCKRPTQ